MRQAAELGVKRVVWDTLSYTDYTGATHAELRKSYIELTGANELPLSKNQLAAEIRKYAREYGIKA